MQTVITRYAASAAGLPHFYTGKPCCNNHDSPRFVSNGGCVACNKERMKAFNTGNRRGRTARLQGLFTYKLHKDDHAKALAYCQALDLDRGYMPHVPAAVVPLHLATAEELEANRRQIFFALQSVEPPPHIPKL